MWVCVLKPVVYVVKMAISQKQCKIKTLLLQTITRKCHVAYWIATYPITLNDHQGHLSVANFSKCGSLNIFAAFVKMLVDIARCIIPTCGLLAFSTGRKWNYLCFLLQELMLIMCYVDIFVNAARYVHDDQTENACVFARLPSSGKV